MNQEIYDSIREIKLDRYSGASQLTRKALSVLRFAVKSSKEKTIEGFLEDLKNIGKKLIEVRTMMTSIQNLVTQVIYEVYNEREQDLVSLKKFAISKIDELIRESEIAIKNTSEKAASMINDSDNIITCSYSSTILETFKMAKKQGKNFKVLVAESKCGKISYGRCLTEKLKSHKISTKVFPDKAIDFYALRSRIALVGADSILIDGSLINGKPTYNVAIATKKNNIPLYTVCETNKFNILTRKPELNKGFDLVPSNLITGIITEKGIIKPDIVVNYSKEKRKFFSLF